MKVMPQTLQAQKKSEPLDSDFFGDKNRFLDPISGQALISKHFLFQFASLLGFQRQSRRGARQ